MNAPSSESPTANPSTSRHPSARTPVAITTAWDTTRAVHPSLALRGGEKDVGELLLGHHHREQGLVDPLAAFEQGREERAGAQLRDPQLQIPRRRRQRAGAVAIALVGAFRGTLVQASRSRR